MQPQPAYLLHRRPYRETSALADLLTLEHGLVRVVARGVQRPGRRTRSVLQPFMPLQITWSGTRDLKTLNMIESSGSPVMLAGEGVICGLYAHELLVRCLPRELPVERVFVHYAGLLPALTRPVERASALRRFEITLLDALDAAPVFMTSDEQTLDPHLHYVYLPEWRRFRQANPGERGCEGRTLNLLAHGDWEARGLAAAARWLTRAALAPLLGDTPLRSRMLIQRLHQQRQRTTLPNTDDSFDAS